MDGKLIFERGAYRFDCQPSNAEGGRFRPHLTVVRIDGKLFDLSHHVPPRRDLTFATEREAADHCTQMAAGWCKANNVE